MNFDFPPFFQIGVNRRISHAATGEDTEFTTAIFPLDHAAALRRACREAKCIAGDLLEDEIYSQLYDTLRELIVLFELAELNKWDHLGKNIIKDVIALLGNCSMVCLKLLLQSAEGQPVLDEATCSDQPSQDAFFVFVEGPNEQLDIFLQALKFVQEASIVDSSDERERSALHTSIQGAIQSLANKTAKQLEGNGQVNLTVFHFMQVLSSLDMEHGQHLSHRARIVNTHFTGPNYGIQAANFDGTTSFTFRH